MSNLDDDKDPIDDRVRAYYEMLGIAQRMVESEGRAYADKCFACGRNKVKRNRAKEIVKENTTIGSNGDRICASKKCAATWGYAEVIVPKGIVQKAPRPGDFENRIASLAPLGYALNQMLRDKERWRWPAQVLVGFCTTVAGYDDLADHANEYAWPHPSEEGWTEARARAAASAARRELRKRMRGPGLK